MVKWWTEQPVELSACSAIDVYSRVNENRDVAHLQWTGRKAVIAPITPGKSEMVMAHQRQMDKRDITTARVSFTDSSESTNMEKENISPEQKKIKKSRSPNESNFLHQMYLKRLQRAIQSDRPRIDHRGKISCNRIKATTRNGAKRMPVPNCILLHRELGLCYSGIQEE